MNTLFIIGHSSFIKFALNQQVTYLAYYLLIRKYTVKAVHLRIKIELT